MLNEKDKQNISTQRFVALRYAIANMHLTELHDKRDV